MNVRWPIITALFVVLLGSGASAQANPGEIGRWSAVQNYPLVPISAAVTGDGKIVAWDQADANPRFPGHPSSGRAMILDPETGAITYSANLAPDSVFCPLITTLPDGKVAIAGGGGLNVISDVVQIYDPKSKTFGTWSSMSTGRWYAGGGISRDGDIVALGGFGSGGGVDVVNAATGHNRRLALNFGPYSYPRALRMPDGRFTIENNTEDRAPTRQILDTSGSGTLTTAGDLTLLESRLWMASTMVGPYTMLGISGGTSRSSYLLDVSTGQPVPRTTGSTKDPHITGAAVTLPDGSALVVGGGKRGAAVLGVERWSPQTGQWTSMENTPRPRQYHSVAALLPDGRVWSAGTSVGASDNDVEAEYNGAYFSPPYLFRQDGSPAPRPQITEAPESATWGQRMTLRSPQAASIRRASLVRMSASTHQYDMSGAFVPLDVSVSGDRVSVDVPSNGNTVPAGSYMVFLLDSTGVPSRAAIVRIDPAADSTPNATAMASSQGSAQYPAWKGYDRDTTNLGVVTKSESEPWWTLDLGRSREMTGLTIHNRNDTTTNAERLRSAWVFASNEPLTSTSVSATRAQAGVTAVQLPSSVGATVTVPLNRSARYIRVQIPRTDVLNFREVTPAFGTTPTPAPNLAVTKASETNTQVVVRVANTGAAAGTISSITMPGAGWAQASGPAAPFTIAAGATTSLTFTRGTANGDLVLTPTSGSALRLALTGYTPPVPPPSVVPDPSKGGWQLNGSASIAGTALQLTPAAADQRGGAFYPTQLDTSGPLTVEFDATIAGGTGADGLAMVLGDPARGATARSLGAGGGSLGFGGIPGWAVALSPFPNGTQTTGNFVGISNGARTGAWRTLSWLAATRLTTPLQNTTRRVRVTITRSTITATVDGGSSITQAVALPARVLLGFTAATGGLTNRHAITRLSVQGGTTPPPPPTNIVPDPAAGGWTLNGSSTITNSQLQLTTPAPDQRGSAFYPKPLSIGTGLTIEYNATIAGGTGADGLAMVLGDPARGATARLLGAGGGSLGFGGIPGWAVGLTTYPISAVGISDGSQTGAWQSLKWLTTQSLLMPLQNTTSRVRVTITRSAITATIDGGATITRTVALPAQVLLGFSAATGGLTNRHTISKVQVTTT